MLAKKSQNLSQVMYAKNAIQLNVLLVVVINMIIHVYLLRLIDVILMVEQLVVLKIVIVHHHQNYLEIHPNMNVLDHQVRVLYNVNMIH